MEAPGCAVRRAGLDPPLSAVVMYGMCTHARRGFAVAGQKARPYKARHRRKAGLDPPLSLTERPE